MYNSNTRASRVFSRSENVSRDSNALKKFLDTPTLRVSTRNARFLRSLITFIYTLNFLLSFACMSARRDPFTCPLYQQKNKVLSVMPKSEKKPDESLQNQWQVHEVQKDSLILKDANGNIREISFAESQKK